MSTPDLMYGTNSPTTFMSHLMNVHLSGNLGARTVFAMTTLFNDASGGDSVEAWQRLATTLENLASTARLAEVWELAAREST